MKEKTKQAIYAPLEGGLGAEAVYYARRVGITRDEAAKIIRKLTNCIMSARKRPDSFAHGSRQRWPIPARKVGMQIRADIVDDVLEGKGQQHG